VGKNHANGDLEVPNHEYMTGGFSSHYMSRNRKKEWDEPSFTIQAGGRHCPLHPSSSRMRKVGPDKWVFIDSDPRYRRLSVRECARIQSFPDMFKFHYKRVDHGYKMVGNAVPVLLAEAVARQIRKTMEE
jgi:DNA (cytosine-5)-methyltransferase 1